MNDMQIRASFHQTILQKEHKKQATLIIDELGLKHGKSRADIAVINGHLIGFEIKSDEDSLIRLKKQVSIYNEIFDYSSIILTEHHLDEAGIFIPRSWGIYLAIKDNKSNIYFKVLRNSKRNKNINSLSVAQLLWKKEVKEILINIGYEETELKENRSVLYQYLVNNLKTKYIQKKVREYLKKREDWRDL